MATTSEYSFDWAELAFASKKPLRELDAAFIAAPREVSIARFKQLIKTYLPKGNIVVGLAKEPYVLGLEDRPQFRTLQAQTIAPVIRQVNAASPKHKVYTLSYSQRDTVFIYDKIAFREVVLINGSWYHGFHHLPEYYTLINNGTPFTKLSPFASEAEAQAYPTGIDFPPLPTDGTFSEADMMDLAHRAASRSYDYAGLQTGGALARKKGQRYELLSTAHNRIVPYETYAMHHGSEREKYFSPLNDLNHYDTIHYEVALLLQALEQGISLDGTTMFQTVLSCPHCTRMLAATPISEVVYEQDHSDGYAVRLLNRAGKTVRRLI